MREDVPLAPLTTFRVGGNARAFMRIADESTLRDALTRAQTGPFALLGGGANLLVPDEGVEGLVLKIELYGVECTRIDASRTCLTAGAGVAWDELVKVAAGEKLWGIENLAGIPGTIGGAAVQNVGAYGGELAQVFEFADAFDLSTGEAVRIGGRQVAFGYRDSIFKSKKQLLITRVALALSNFDGGKPELSYKDLHDAALEGPALTTPEAVGEAVRGIRARKFPDLSKEGTAGSFFKNPVVSEERALALAREFPGLPQFLQPGSGVKLSLAWLLDHVLALKGYSVGGARVFENQPLVIAARSGALARDVDALAREVERRVTEATGIVLEREVERFVARDLS